MTNSHNRLKIYVFSTNNHLSLIEFFISTKINRQTTTDGVFHLISVDSEKFKLFKNKLITQEKQKFCRKSNTNQESKVKYIRQETFGN